MTALRLTNSLPAPDAPVSSDWLSVSEVAKRLDLSDRHVRRICEQKWQRVGLAKLDDGQWIVHVGADPKLNIAAKASHLQMADEVLRNLPEDARKQSIERKRILDAWEAALSEAVQSGRKREEVTKAFVAVHKVPRTTLYRWRKDWKACGFEGLVDQRKATPVHTGGGMPAGRSESEGPELELFMDEVRRAWLRLGKPKASVCYEIARLAALENGWAVPSYRHVCRLLKQTDMATRVRLREGPTAFTDKCEPSIQRDYSKMAANEMWVGDHHVFDVWVEVGKKVNRKTGELEPIYRRPWLTAFQDMATRKIVAWEIRAADPDTEAILAALLNGFRSHGIPESSYCDNGKDFDAKTLTGETKAERRKTMKGKRRIEFDRDRIGGMYAALGIRHIRAIPYRPQSKPIERFFRTYEERDGRLWPTYCGSSPTDRPEGLPGRMHLAPTLAEFIEHFREWLEADYHDRIHTGDSMNCTPNQAWSERLIVRRDAPDELLAVVTQKRVGPVAVTKLGVRHKGLYYGQMTDEIAKRLGGRVYLRINPDRVGIVSVWDERDRFICIAPANVKVPANASSQDLRKAIADQKRQRRKMLEGARAQEQLKESLPSRLNKAAKARAAEQAPTPPDTPPIIKPVISGLASELSKYKRQSERFMRKAVGDGVDMACMEQGGSARFEYRTSGTDEAEQTPANFRYKRERGEGES